MPGTEGLAGRRQRDVDGLGHQYFFVALGTQDRQSLIEKLLGFGTDQVHPFAGIGTVIFGQPGQRLAGQCQRSAIAEMLGLGAGQRIEIGGGFEGVAGRINGGGQRIWRNWVVETFDGLLTHGARFSLADLEADLDFPARV